MKSWNSLSVMPSVVAGAAAAAGDPLFLVAPRGVSEGRLINLLYSASSSGDMVLRAGVAGRPLTGETNLALTGERSGDG